MDSILENDKFNGQKYYRREASSNFHELILLDNIEIGKHLTIINDIDSPHCLSLTQERVTFLS